MQSSEFTIDSNRLKKLAPMPILVAVVVGIISRLTNSFGGLAGLLMFAIWIWAGILYSKNIYGTGEKPTIINLAFNAAILSGLVELANSITYWIMYAIQGYASTYIAGILSGMIQAAVVGGLAAVGWYFYQTNKKVQ